MPIIGWRHYGDPAVVPLCRSRNGSIVAVGDKWQAGAAALAREAVDYLPQGSPAVCVAETTHLVHVEPERFLGFE